MLDMSSPSLALPGRIEGGETPKSVKQSGGLGTHFRPMQALNPNENGWLASFVSEHEGSNHLSGLKAMGSWK